MPIVVNKERVFRIGTASACEIIVPEGIPSNVVWVHLAINDDSMHLLTVVEHSITCCVNGNTVSNQYWVNEDDIIEIEGKTLNWDYFKGDSNEPFRNDVQKKRSIKKALILIPVGLVVVGVILFAMLYEKPEPPHIPNASELYHDASAMIASVNDEDIRAGYNLIERLAIDSLYVPAVLKHYEVVKVAKDTLKWDAIYECMYMISKDSLNMVATYECALCMSYISPKLSLPEVQQYDFVKNKSYEDANALFDVVIQNDRNSYKAPFWKIINMITLYNGKSLSDAEREHLNMLYQLLDKNLELSTEDLAIQYKAETERVIKVILQNWQIID